MEKSDFLCRVRRQVALAAAVGVGLVLMIHFGVQLRQQIELLRASPRDNVQWTLSQLEVDLLVLADSVLMAESRGAMLRDTRKRFDSFYSRQVIIAEGSVFADLRASEAFRDALGEIRAATDELVPLFDGSDDDLQRALPRVHEALIALRPAIRGASMEGISLFAEASDERNGRFFSLLSALSLVAAGLIVILGLTVLFMLRAHRRLAASSEEILRSRSRLAATINGALDAIVVIDHRGRIVEFNEAAETVFGYPRKMALGADMSELIVPEAKRKAHSAGVKRIVGGGAPRMVDQGRIELNALRANGAEFPVEMSVASAVGESGPIYIGYLRDISARLEAEQALRVARDDALAADRAKSEFFAITSHEMRTPLNGVLGVLDILKHTELDPKQESLIDTAAASGEILLHHINEVLDIARIDSGQVMIDEAPVELSDLLQEVVQVSTPVARAGDNSIRLKVSPDIGPFLSDPNRIRQIALNLVGNAAKFSENSVIVIEARPLETEGGPPLVEFSVQDSGIGIPDTDLERIFDDFVTLDASYGRRRVGSGLGLAICRRIVTAMGGEIGVESQLGEGSRFWVRLPAPPAPEPAIRPVAPALPAEPAEPAPDAQPLNVLVVEDNETNRMVVREMLLRFGHDVTEAHDGLDGLAKAEQAPFDLILMDISMPGLDGVETTRRIRAGAGRSQGSAIIGLTAHATAKEHKAFVAAGMQAVITKPLRSSALQNVIAAHVSQDKRDRPPEDPAPAGDAAERVNDCLDLEVLLELAEMLPEDLFDRTLIRASEEIRAQVPDLRAQIGDGDLDGAASASHKLAGSVALVGADRLHGQLSEIEQACKAGRRDKVLALVDDSFSTTVDATLEALGKVDMRART